MTRGTRMLAAIALVTLLAMGAGAAKALPAAGARAAEPHLALAAQTAWVRPGGELDLRVAVDGVDDPSGFQLFVGVHRAVRTRSAFLRTVEGRSLGSVVDVSTTTLADLAPDADGAYTLRLGVQGDDQPPDPTLLQLPGLGVYPVEVELRDRDGDVVDAFTTHLVDVGRAEGLAPLDVALVVPLHAPPALGPDLRRRLDAERLSGAVAAIAASPVPLVLAPTPETLDAWAAGTRPRDRSALADLGQAAARRQVVALPYVPVHVDTLVGAGLGDELRDQRDAGAAAVTRVLGVRPDTHTWIADGHLDEDGLGRLARQGVTRVVVPERHLTSVDLLVTLAQPFALRGEGERRYPAVMADAGLATHFRTGSDQVLAAHQLLADLAVLALDQPAVRRGVVALPPEGWPASAPFLDVVLDGLATSPLVAPVTLPDLFRHVEPARTSGGRALARRLAPVREERLGVSRASVHALRDRTDAFASLLEADNPLGDLLRHARLVAESADLRSPAARRAYLDAARARIAAQVAQIQIPGERSITLTARRGEIPVTFRNQASYPVRVAVQLESDKLSFPHAPEPIITLPPSRSHTERFTVETRTSGAFPLRVRLRAPDGDLVIGETRFTIRSTAASEVAIVLSVGAALFLLVWWLRNFRGRRAPALVPT